MKDINETLKMLPSSAEELAHQLQKYQSFTHNLTGEGDFTVTTADTYTLWFSENGAGDETSFIFLNNSADVLFFAFEHESKLSNYGKANEPAVDPVFHGMPENLSYLLEDSTLFWSWDDTGMKKIHATSAAWLTQGAWSVSDQFQVEAEMNQDDGGLYLATGISRRINNEKELHQYFIRSGFSVQEIQEASKSAF